MSLNKKFCLINFFIFFFSSFAFAENKIAYVNLDLILSESKPAKLLFSKLKEIEENKIKEFKNAEMNLKEEEKKLISKKKLISDEEYKKNVNIFKKKVDSYRNKKKIKYIQIIGV